MANVVYGLETGGGTTLVSWLLLTLMDGPCAEAKRDALLNKIVQHTPLVAPPAYCDYMGGFEANPMGWTTSAGIVVGLIVSFFAYFVGYARHRT